MSARITPGNQGWRRTGQLVKNRRATPQVNLRRTDRQSHDHRRAITADRRGGAESQLDLDSIAEYGAAGVSSSGWRDYLRPGYRQANRPAGSPTKAPGLHFKIRLLGLDREES